MSSPPAAPTPLQPSHSQKSLAQARPPTGTNPSTPGPTTGTGTPGQHPTPSSTAVHQAPFLSPSVSRIGGIAGKTPAGKSIPGKGPGGKGPPMHGSVGQHSSSPAVGAAMAVTPSLSGVPLGSDSPSQATLAAVGMEATASSIKHPNLSGFGLNSLGASLSTMGMLGSLSQGMMVGASSMGPKLDDAERRRRLESVLGTVGSAAGRISQEGVERLARKMGLEMYDELRDGERSIMIAGKDTFAVDIVFRPSSSPTVAQTEFQFHGVNDTTIADFSPAAAVLRENLSPPPGTSPINGKLDSFSQNLEQISKLEKLSGPGANCFEAISGVYQSLSRLYEHEKKIAETIAATTDSNEDAETTVTCNKSGRPHMNARKSVGLSIDYWRNEHLLLSLFSSPVNAASNTEGDVDHPMPDVPSANDFSDDNAATYTIHIDCEASAAALYPPIRTSNDWVSAEVTKPAATADVSSDANTTSEIDWQEPPVATLSNAADVVTPTARFLAHLDPLVILPLNVAIQVYASVGVDISQEHIGATTWDGLVVPSQGQLQGLGHHSTGHSSQPAVAIKRVLVFPSDNTDIEDNSTEIKEEGLEQTWTARLTTHHPELARDVTTFPFSHPKQLIALLPILRQYAVFAQLVRSVAPTPVPFYDLGSNDPYDTVNFPAAAAKENQSMTLQDELDALLSDMPVPGPNEELHRAKSASITDSLNNDTDILHDLFHATDDEPAPRVLDVEILQLTPVPRLVVVVPTGKGLLKARVDVGEGAQIDVGVGGEAVDGEEEERKRLMERAFAKGLAVGEDLVAWGEWVRGKFADP